MFRSRCPRISGPLKISRRYLHSVPRLDPHGDSIKHGIKDFLSADGFQLAWTEYQGFLVHKLNSLVAGTEDANSSTEKLLKKFAREPNFAPHFNYASMAHNNHFFFQGISPERVAMPSDLEKGLKSSFGSIETLKREFIVTASSMFGPGFVWLVKEGGKYSILCTYLAGSPYADAHYRQQPVDMNTEDKTIPEAIRRANQSPYANTVGAHGPHSEARKGPGAAVVTPLLCLNTWEHVYLPDYGFGSGGNGGKKHYAECWWDKIDWTQVQDRAGLRGKDTFYT